MCPETVSDGVFSGFKFSQLEMSTYDSFFAMNVRFLTILH